MMDSVQIQEKRAAAEARLAALRDALGAAIVDGKSFSSKEIAALEAELDGIAAAEGELARRSRAEAAAEEAALRLEIRTAYGTAEAARLAALGEAERAAKAFADACRAVVAAGAGQRAALARLRAPVPVHLIETEILSRLSHRLSAALSGIGARGFFGELGLHPGPHPGERAWTEGEAAPLEEQQA